MREAREVRDLARDVIRLISIYEQINDPERRRALRLEIIESKNLLEERLEALDDEEEVFVSISAASGAVAVSALIAILTNGASVALIVTSGTTGSVSAASYVSKMMVRREKRRVKREMRRIEAVLMEIESVSSSRR